MKNQIGFTMRIGAAVFMWTAGANALAQNATQIYGVLDVWGGSSRTSGSGKAVPVVNGGGMTTSYWGVGGSEELGSNLKAIYALEGYLQPDTGAAGRSSADALFARNAFVGVAGPLGELKAGRILNPLFVATAQTNPFGGSIRFAPLLAQVWSVPMGRAVAGDTSWDNTVSYTTPLLNGARLSAYVGLGETGHGSGTRNAGATLSWSGRDWFVSGTVQRAEVGPGLARVGTSAQTTCFAGGWYDLKVAKLFGSYGNADSDRPDARARTSQLGVAIPVGLGAVMLSLAQTKNSGAGVADTRRDTGAVGYDYFLSRRTDLYAVVQYDRLSTANAARSYGAGIRLKF